MSAFDLGASVPVGTATRVVVRSMTMILTPPGAESISVSYTLTDSGNGALSRDAVATYPMPGAILTAINNHLSTKLQALIGQTATLNGAAGV